MSQNTEPGTIESIQLEGSWLFGHDRARPPVAGAAVIQKPYFTVRCVDDGRFAEEKIN
jgi:hypothetical protein